MAAHRTVGGTEMLPKEAAPNFAAPNLVVKVGQPAQDFIVNKQIISSLSGFFQKACKPTWFLGSKGIIELPDDNPTVFNVYVNWIYSKKLYVYYNEGEHGDSGDGHFNNLIDAYALGDKIIDIDFKDAVCDAMASLLTKKYEGSQWMLNLAQRKRVYSKTVPDASLRRLLVKRLASSPDLHLLLKPTDPGELLLDVTLVLRGNYFNWEFEQATQTCEFHEHASGAQNCYRRKLK